MKIEIKAATARLVIDPHHVAVMDLNTASQRLVIRNANGSELASIGPSAFLAVSFEECERIFNEYSEWVEE
jgi:hypothetical protein